MDNWIVSIFSPEDIPLMHQLGLEDLLLERSDAVLASSESLDKIKSFVK
jgi:hypothetical protein